MLVDDALVFFFFLLSSLTRLRLTLSLSSLSLSLFSILSSNKQQQQKSRFFPRKRRKKNGVPRPHTGPPVRRDGPLVLRRRQEAPGGHGRDHDGPQDVGGGFVCAEGARSFFFLLVFFFVRLQARAPFSEQSSFFFRHEKRVRVADGASGVLWRTLGEEKAPGRRDPSSSTTDDNERR